MKMKAAALSLTIVLGLARAASAYPDLVRHHYVNCSACHVAPTGGGLLNNYGKSISRELLSASGGEREAEFLHGALPAEAMKDWLLVGGDVRGIQIRRETPDTATTRSILMQANLELGFVQDKTTFVIQIGQPEQPSSNLRLVAPRYYVLTNLRDEWSVRTGRFLPVFGIMHPYHTLPTRQGVGLGAGLERDTIETVWGGEQWNFAGSVSQSPPEWAPAQREHLTTAQAQRTFNDSYRVGLSLLRGSTSAMKRDALSVHGILGFSPKWAYLSEFVFQDVNIGGVGAQRGLYHYGQLIWEVAKGWNLYLIETYQKSNIDDSGTLVDSRGPGVRYFPRPHFEIEGTWFKKRTAQIADRYDDEAWLLAHYYF